MSFQTQICSIMTADASVNKLVTGGIYFDTLPINFDLKKIWVVYNYVEEDRIDVLGEKNVLTMYKLYAKVVSPDTNNLLTITDELNRYLSTYTSTNFLDFLYENDNHSSSIVDDTDIFENTIEYSITYKK